LRCNSGTFRSSRVSLGVLAWIALVSLLPWQASYAYIDPGTAGPIYQLLLPLLIAIASGFAAFRRAIKRAWDRLTGLLRGPEPTAESDTASAERDRAA
jgi:hypothetical protein